MEKLQLNLKLMAVQSITQRDFDADLEDESQLSETQDDEISESAQNPNLRSQACWNDTGDENMNGKEADLLNLTEQCEEMPGMIESLKEQADFERRLEKEKSRWMDQMNLQLATKKQELEENNKLELQSEKEKMKQELREEFQRDEEEHQHALERKTRQDTENAENVRLRKEQQKTAASEKKKVLGLMIGLNCGRVAR
jgi:hypothetical protein